MRDSDVHLHKNFTFAGKKRSVSVQLKPSEKHNTDLKPVELVKNVENLKMKRLMAKEKLNTLVNSTNTSPKKINFSHKSPFLLAL